MRDLLDWNVIELIGGLLILAIGGTMWRLYWPGPREEKRIWRCFRYQGGGGLVSPGEMTLKEATRWLGHDCNAEVAHVDYDNAFIFYRPRGG